MSPLFDVFKCLFIENIEHLSPNPVFDLRSQLEVELKVSIGVSVEVFLRLGGDLCHGGGGRLGQGVEPVNGYFLGYFGPFRPDFVVGVWEGPVAAFIKLTRELFRHADEGSSLCAWPGKVWVNREFVWGVVKVSRA